MAYRRALEKPGLILPILVTQLTLSCTSEEIVTVEPSFVAVRPGDVSATVGERVQLVGMVHDERNFPLSGAELVWSSADTSIATVDSLGLVTARAPGEVTISATFRHVTGEATVVVLRGPSVVVVPSSLTLYTAPGAALPPQVVAVSNGGGGALGQLVSEVSYVGGAQGWLGSTLASATAPTSLTLRVSPEQLAAGSHRASVSITSLTDAEPAQVDVVVNVAGFEVGHTGGATTVAESGTTDEISVVLSSPPSAPVMLLASSSDAGEVTVTPASLRFTRDDWDRAQTFTVRGADDIDDDGDQISTVSISVDGQQSPDAYDVLPARTVSVTTVDDDEPPSLVVVESDGSTVVSENNTTDDFTVALAAPIASNVVVEITSSNLWEVGVMSTMYLTFTPAAWNVPQAVTLVGINDFWRDGDRLVNVTIRVLDFYSDDRYDGLSKVVVVRNIDNDGGG